MAFRKLTDVGCSEQVAGDCKATCRDGSGEEMGREKNAAHARHAIPVRLLQPTLCLEKEVHL